MNGNNWHVNFPSSVACHFWFVWASSDSPDNKMTDMILHFLHLASHFLEICHLEIFRTFDCEVKRIVFKFFVGVRRMRCELNMFWKSTSETFFLYSCQSFLNFHPNCKSCFKLNSLSFLSALHPKIAASVWSLQMAPSDPAIDYQWHSQTWVYYEIYVFKIQIKFLNKNNSHEH